MEIAHCGPQAATTSQVGSGAWVAGTENYRLAKETCISCTCKVYSGRELSWSSQ